MKPSASDRRRESTARRPRSSAKARTLDARVDEHLAFFESFLRGPASVGAIAPSSPALARAMIVGCNLSTANTVVELGPGTGSFTEQILQGIGRRTKFIAIELDEQHVHRLRRRFPDTDFYHDSAAQLPKYLAKHAKQKADVIVSGLPWASIPASDREQIMRAVVESLAPGGVFTTFGYFHTRLLPSAKRFAALLRREFAKVERSKLVWRNFPPAYVYRCTMGKA